jgi:hypothetical protein
MVFYIIEDELEMSYPENEASKKQCPLYKDVAS